MPTLFITGANRGIGLEFAKQYAQQGWRVIATCRQPDEAENLKKLQQEFALEILALDVTNEQQIAAIKQTLKNTAIDVLLLNAGIYGPVNAFLGNIHKQDLQELFLINTIAPLLLIQALAENVLVSQQKIVVAISSGYGSIGETRESGHYPYAISKAGLNMAIKTAAIELAAKSGIAVTLSPGWVRTDMGGPNAALSVAESVAHLSTIINKLTLADSGKFFSYTGREISW